ncbi:LOW QUALITY PROTEIN: protein PAXX [Pterocles gutturalis]
MAEPAGPFHLLRAGPGRYLCYCGPDGTVYVTDALEVWAGELGTRPPLGCRCQPEEHGTKLRGPQQRRDPGPLPPAPAERRLARRAAVGRGAAALSLGGGRAALELPGEPRCSALELRKLPAGEARSQLQALLFGMAGRVRSLERRLEEVEKLVSSCSPEKNAAWSQQRFLPDPSPRKKKDAGSALPAKRRIAGESLINPGFKSKKAPSGVDFEDS